MEDYIDLNVAPTNVHVVDANLMVTNEIVPEESERASIDRYDDSSYGQQWDIMEEYIDETPDSETIDRSINNQEPLTINENNYDYIEDDQVYVAVDENQNIALNNDIVESQDENPYYNPYNPMVHEHLVDDYSGYIPNINGEYVDYGLGNIYSYDIESPQLDRVPKEVYSNYIEPSNDQNYDAIARNSESDIISEPLVESTTENAANEKEYTTEVEVTTSEATTTTEEMTDEISETTESFTTNTETSAEEEETTMSLQTSTTEKNTLPPNLEALNLVLEDSNQEIDQNEVYPTLPEPKPYLQNKDIEELFILPAGHGLRYKFKIKDLNYYNPDFGFVPE